MSFLSILNSDKARRIFRKRELEIMRKQLFGVVLTQSEKNRLSRNIRKKLEVIRELAQFEQEFELKKSAEIKKLINEALEIIKESKCFTRVKKIVLYGSAVENKLSFNSDIDIAIELDEAKPKEAAQIRLDLLAKANDRIDLQIYNILPLKIKQEIDKILGESKC